PPPTAQKSCSYRCLFTVRSRWQIRQFSERRSIVPYDRSAACGAKFARESFCGRAQIESTTRFALERGRAAARKSAGHDEFKRAQIGREIDRNTMNRNATMNMKPKCCELAFVHPHARAVAAKFSTHTHRSRERDRALGHRFDVADDSARKPHDRIRDQ